MPTNLDFHIDDKEMVRMFDRFKKRGTEVLRVALIEAMRQVGLVSVNTYMVAARHVKPGFSIGTAGSKLNIRTGRLARSLLDGFTFGGGLGGVREGIRRIIKTSEGLDAIYGSSVPYARIEEKGGMTHPTVTNRSHRFFWAMWYQTGVPMWKGMALSRKSKFNVKIPARPYLEPALETAKPKIYDIFQQRMKLFVQEIQR